MEEIYEGQSAIHLVLGEKDIIRAICKFYGMEPSKTHIVLEHTKTKIGSIKFKAIHSITETGK